VVSDGRVRYARNGDVHLACRVLGDGEIPLVLVPGWVVVVEHFDALTEHIRCKAPGVASPKSASADTPSPQDPALTAPTLNYGQTHTVGAITCDSEPAGVTCTDSSTRHFFFDSRESYQLG
jgi:hypothetical protein